jgi:hypothetical protein
MMTTTRAEHLAWCKERALAYLPDDPGQAIASMISDLRKHPETERHSAIELGAMLIFSGHLSRPAAVERWIEGFR